MFIRRIIFISIFTITSLISQGQISLSDTLLNAPKILLRKEISGFIMAHTGGFGIGYRNGRHLTGYKKRMFEIELTNMKNPKEVRTINHDYDNTKSFIYGKENSFYILRAGIGIQKIINSKPYWGGVELRYFYYGGLSLGLLKPVYLYILQETTTPYVYNLVIEKYDPNIYGRAPFFHGFWETKPIPGIYLKTGVNFEFGVFDETLKALEAGIAADVYPEKIPIMANNKNTNYFVSLYVSFHLGKRKN